MFDPNLTIWQNGQLSSLTNGGVSPLTHSLHYGSGAFEGIRAYQTDDSRTHIFRLSEHIDRLFYSAEKVFIDIPYSKDELVDACKVVVKENNLTEAYIRPLVFHDDSSLGVCTTANKPQVLIAAWSWGKYLGDSVSVLLSPYKRISEASVVADAKISGHYVNSLLATTHAKKLGYDEALLLDHADNIAEGPGENIFFIKGTELHTPKLGKILSGITRDAVISFAKDCGYTVQERAITVNELSSFDSAFFTGTAAEITPIEKIDSIEGTLQTFDLEKSNEIKEYFFNIIRGKNKKYQDWLTFV